MKTDNKYPTYLVAWLHYTLMCCDTTMAQRLTRFGTYAHLLFASRLSGAALLLAIGWRTGSKHVCKQDGKVYDFSDSLVYAMKVTDKMTLAEYDRYCKHHLPHKIPQPANADWRLRAGDCVYEYGEKEVPAIRNSYHGSDYLNRDLSGMYALLSTQFYYFGEAARHIPFPLRSIIKKNQGHLRIAQDLLLLQFEAWIQQFEVNRLYGAPQLRFKENRMP